MKRRKNGDILDHSNKNFLCSVNKRPSLINGRERQEGIRRKRGDEGALNGRKEGNDIEMKEGVHVNRGRKSFKKASD